MTLGDLIAKLERIDSSWEVRFDFCCRLPLGFRSWRGVYAELALGHYSYDDLYDEKRRHLYPKEAPKVKDLLSLARECIGKEFDGYKSGTYIMNEATEVWVDNYSECTHTEISFVEPTDSLCILHTEYRGWT